jgi:hypothetical protein
MAGGFTSPSPFNLVIPKGFMIFTEDGTNDPVHLGNATKITYKPGVPVADHYTEMAGTKLLDFSTIIQKGGTIDMTPEERTAYNISLFFLGVPTYGAGPYNSIASVGIFSRTNQIQGVLQIIPTNDVGPRWSLYLTRVLIAPSGDYEMIGDNYAAMPLTMRHVVDDNLLFGNQYLLPDNSSVAPVNWFAPFISGPLQGSPPPAFAKVGEVMTVNIGAWTGPESYTYQWFANGHEIVGATGKTFTPTISQEGEVLTADVTATNSVGSTVVLSGPTLPVHA